MLAATARRLATAGRPRSLAALAQASPKLDWSEVSARCSGDEAKREVAKLKKTVEDLKEMLATQAKEPEKIDFAFYRKQLVAAPGVVDAFEKAYSGLKLPVYEGKEEEQLKAKFQELDKAALAMEASAKKRMGELEAMLVALTEEKAKIKTLTVDQVLAADPALRAELNKEIVEDKWY